MVVRNGLHKSVGSGKLLSIDSYSTNTKTNPFCMKMNSVKNGNTICEKCYSHRMLGTYRKNMADALQHNSDMLSEPIEWDDLPKVMDLYIRFNSHGELINEIHFRNIINICNKNLKTSFALWTKRKDIVQRVLKYADKPANLRLVFSNNATDKIMSKPPLHFDKTFNNVSKGTHVDRQNCTGQKCRDCLACYTVNDTTTIVEEVK
jgi:hypothetical protein